MAYPVIGVTTMRRKTETGLQLSSLGEAYIEALLQAGVCPVLIPNQLPEAAVETLLPRLHGVVFTGGGDIKTSYYQGQEHPKVDGVDPDRDRVELLLLERVVSNGVPFLGICRGLQLINVGLGGTLYADIADQVPGAEKHDFYKDWNRDYLAHSVEVEPGTRLSGIIGDGKVEVNSLHHQAVDKLAPDLVVTAAAPDGIVEAVEIPEHPFGLAVQWHPEWLTAHSTMRALFAAFAAAVKD
jgi:putative glutamine amidotransferase